MQSWSVETPEKPAPDVILKLLRERSPLREPVASWAVALSPSLLDEAGSWTSPKADLKVQTALAEARTLDGGSKPLAIDVVARGKAALGIALQRTQLDALAAQGLSLVTSSPAALAALFGALCLNAGGERLEIRLDGRGSPQWRVRPTSAPDDVAPLRYQTLEVLPAQAAALAAALVDPEAVPNLLRNHPSYQIPFVRRFRDALLGVTAAAALLCAALGVRFHREAARENAVLEQLRTRELQAWDRLLPGQEPRPGRLLQAVREQLGDTVGPKQASALAFWGELARHLPDPDALGLTLESLDLAPEGGRLSGRLPVSKDDPLKAAAQLEGALGQSKKMTLRGDSEVREGQVHVRLRMDYSP